MPLLYEGIKETENTRIEKDNETLEEIEMLYSFGVVLFEHVIVESDDLRYSICYFAPRKIYDIVIEGKNERKLHSYECKKELDGSLKDFFALIKNEQITVDDERYICASHSVEYTL